MTTRKKYKTENNTKLTQTEHGNYDRLEIGEGGLSIDTHDKGKSTTIDIHRVISIKENAVYIRDSNKVVIVQEIIYIDCNNKENRLEINKYKKEKERK